ncbi:hypothetical protein V5O48_012515 [Marasmius crinis-equi]|uniref:Transposase n=1 Tax=Marasmius crinis-equi TaxID=585013 RepID=A0ABR3F2L8_9AGAR
MPEHLHETCTQHNCLREFVGLIPVDNPLVKANGMTWFRSRDKGDAAMLRFLFAIAPEALESIKCPSHGGRYHPATVLEDGQTLKLKMVYRSRCDCNEVLFELPLPYSECVKAALNWWKQRPYNNLQPSNKRWRSQDALSSYNHRKLMRGSNVARMQVGPPRLPAALRVGLDK